MQTRNYKDWQNECEGITPSGFGAFSFIISIIIQFQSFLSEPSLSGGLGIGVDIADSLIADDVSQLSAREVRDLIQSGLTDLAISIASGSFNDIVEKYRDYLEVFKRWESGGRTDDDTRETIGRLIMDAERAAAELNQFSHGDYKIPLLPTYAQAANLHLKILRDILIHGEDLQIISTADRQFYRDKLFGGLKNYTNYCVDQYNAGLNQIKEAGTSAANWLRFHRFRREMTLSVLDLIALFPTYDIDSYDLPVNVELSRIIYTDPVGWTVEGMSTIYPWYSPYNRLAFNQLEAETIRGPYLSTWLDYIDIYSSQYSSLKVWSGNANTMKTIGGETRRQDGSAVGTPQRINVGNTDIFKVELTAGVHHFLIDYTNPNPLRSYGIINSKFFMTNGSTPTYTGSVGSMHTQTGKVAALPGVESEVPTANDYTHRLSDVINLTGGLPQHGSNSVRSSLVAHG
ncbi:insecticidal delta-endotoxin Cry8Ea1 family protein, partial [Bacillus thuringiensis]|uniref:insecticidal delta-endotoxin Cry8Ea1 family protein n=1 Tax=Bacillus thuringiensis TaxID=1428 RepID=UPI001594732A